MRLAIYVLILFAVASYIISSLNVVFPKPIDEILYFKILIFSAAFFCLILITLKELKVPKVGLTGASFGIWAISSIFLKNSLLESLLFLLFLILNASLLYEEEWVRLFRFLGFTGVFISWPIILGKAGESFLQKYFPFLASLIFLYFVFLFIPKFDRFLKIWAFLSFVFLIGILGFILYENGLYPLLKIYYAKTQIESALNSGNTKSILNFAPMVLVWVSIWISIILTALRRKINPLWIAGTTGAFLSLLIFDPFLNIWPIGSGIIFVVFSALIEWVLNFRGIKSIEVEPR